MHFLLPGWLCNKCNSRYSDNQLSRSTISCNKIALVSGRTQFWPQYTCGQICCSLYVACFRFLTYSYPNLISSAKLYTLFGISQCHQVFLPTNQITTSEELAALLVNYLMVDKEVWYRLPYNQCTAQKRDLVWPLTKLIFLSFKTKIIPKICWIPWNCVLMRIRK